MMKVDCRLYPYSDLYEVKMIVCSAACLVLLALSACALAHEFFSHVDFWKV